MKIIKPALLVSGVLLFLMACASNLKPLGDEAARSLLPWLDYRMTKEAVIEKLGRFWLYSDKSGRALVYGMEEKNSSVIVPTLDRALATYELVLIFDQNYRLQRYSLIKIK